MKAEAIAKAEAAMRRRSSAPILDLAITSLAQDSKRPTQFISVHFFSPVSA